MITLIVVLVMAAIALLFLMYMQFCKSLFVKIFGRPTTMELNFVQVIKE